MDSMTWQQQQPRGSVFAEKTTWLLLTAFALLIAGMTVNQSTTAFFTDTRVVSGNNFITASVALNETPFTAFNFEKFVPGDVFVRPVQVTNSTASNSGAINVNYYMTVKDNFSNCSTQDPKCTDAKGTLSDPVNGLRLVAIRCFSDLKGTENVACESSSLRSVRLVKGVMETIWPGGSTNATTDIAGVVRDRNQTVQYGNVGGTGSEEITSFPGLPNSGDASDYFGRPIVFAQAGALSTQPISVKINPRRNDTNNPAVLGAATLTNTSTPVVQGSDVLRIGGTVQDLDGNWRKKVVKDASGNVVGSPNVSDECGSIKVSQLTGAVSIAGVDLAVGCGGEVVGVPIQTLSNPNCNGLATSAANRSVVNASGNQGSQAGPGANATVISVNQAALAPQVFSTQSQGACFMGGSEFEKNAPIVLSPRINNQLMAAGAGETPRILSDIPAQSLFDQVNTIAGLGAGKSDNLALIVYLPSWATQSTQDETGSTTALTVQSRQTLDAQNNPVSVPTGGVGNKTGGKASYTVAFTAVQPVGQTFALANVAQQSVNTLAALAGQINTNSTAFQAQSTDVGVAGAALITGGIQTLSPNNLPGGGTEIISVTGRGFAKVTGIPQSVKAETSTASGTLAAGTYKYIVTAGTAGTPTTGGKTWEQGEPSATVSVTTTGSTSTNTITFALVPGATYYNVYRDDGTTKARISVVAATAANSTIPLEAGFVAGSIVGVVDRGVAAGTGTGNNLTDYVNTFPAVGRPCVAYASPSFTFGMCPKIEVFAAGDIPVTGGAASSALALKTGEVMAVSGTLGVARTGATTAYAPGSSSGLLQTDPSKLTDPVNSVLSSTADTVGFLSANQVTFQATTSVVPSLTKYGVRITNPGHPSLPLDIRSKVMTFKDSISVIPQKTTGYKPPVIGKISSGNTLVISGTGFQKGSIVQLGYFGTEATAGSPVRAAYSSSNFISKSHIKNRDNADVTLIKLGTNYATGYNADITSARVTAARALVVSGTVDEPSLFDANGLVAKELGTVAVGASQLPVADIPFFSFDHTKVEVNTDTQITIKGVTVTNAFNIANAGGTVAARVYNPDGSVVEGATFSIAAPGIEQIVQLDSSGQPWLSAAQGRTVTLRFKGLAASTQFKGPARNSTYSIPTVSIACYGIATDTSGKKADGSASVVGSEYDPCLSPSTGARDIGVSQVGNLKVISSTALPPFTTPDSGEGDIVEGTFTISSNAVVGLRRFTMTNGDSAVFSNYFSISQAPTFTRLTYTSGTNRIVADNLSSTKLLSDPTANFNVEGKLPRGATRRVLISGTGFVRGSFASMIDPNISGSTAAVPGGSSPCTGLANAAATSSCFGQRSANGLVEAAVSATTTPKITFSNAGVSVADALTTVVYDTGIDLSMSSTGTQSAAIESPFIATKRLTAVISVTPGATAGPVTMTVTNPDGGQVIVPNAFIVDGTPTIDVTQNSLIATGGNQIVTASNASIKQGEVKKDATAIFIYGSGFFNNGDGRVPQVLISGTGVRVTSVRLSNVNPGTGTSLSDANQNDTVLRVELAAESTAPTGTRDITIVLPDGQSITKTGVFTVNAP